MLYFLNTAILPNPGRYDYQEISLDEALNLWNASSNRMSAIGHLATCQVLNGLGFDIQNNRIEIKMESGDSALVFKLNKRLEEGKVLNKEEILNMGFFFALLKCEKNY